MKKDRSQSRPASSRVDIRREDGKRWVPAPFTLPDALPAGAVFGAWLAADESVEWTTEQRGHGVVTTGYKIVKRKSEKSE